VEGKEVKYWEEYNKERREKKIEKMK